MCTYWMHVDQPAYFLSRFPYPVESKAGVHLVGELAALQPLEGGHGGAIVPVWNKFTQFVCSFCHGLPISKWLTLGLSFQKKKKYSRVFLISPTLSSVRSVPSTVLQNHILSSSADNNTNEQSGGPLQKPHLKFTLNLCKKLHFRVSVRDAAAVFLFWRVCAAIAARPGKTEIVC